MPGSIAFVCAMPMELSPLKRRLSLEKTRVGSLEAHVGELDGGPVVAIVTGMGTSLAARAVERLLEAMEVTRVLVVGITGAVEDETPIGALILPEVVVDGATGAEFRPTRLGDGSPDGKMWTSDDLITDPAVISGLRSDGVVSLDMETAAIARVCDRRGIPWSVFRSISDRATDGSVDEEVFHLSNQDGTPNAKAIASYVLRRPGRLPAMARMAKAAKLATERAAEAALSALAAPAPPEP
ncbi:MAG TPA: 5'-methylthioadenosine/S-adenosylhomocysteine nucleosidase [Acidimicrobiales bacterium]